VRTKKDAARRTTEELARLRVASERLRQQRIALLRAEREKVRDQAAALETELRFLGERPVARAPGRIDWLRLLERVGTTFTAQELRELSGASPRHIAVVTHKWRQEGRIEKAGHGVFRKLSRQRRS